MVALRAFAALAMLSPVSASGGTSKVTPVQKVIQMMEAMLEKGKAEKNAEQVQFAAYKMFCDNTIGEKEEAIEKAGEQLEVLAADVEKNTALIAKLGKEIKGLEKDVDTWTKEKKDTVAERKVEKEDYDKMHQDYAESIDALKRAIAVLKEKPKNLPQAAFAQLTGLKGMSFMPDSAKRAITAFMEDDPLDVTAPEAYGYESQSGGVIDMLEKFLDKFIAENTAHEQAEMEAKSAYELQVQELTNQIEQGEEDRGQKIEYKSKCKEAKATAEADTEETRKSMKEDQKYLKEVQATCNQKAKDFEARQELRQEELVAINKAIEIVGSGAVSGNAKKHLPSFAQRGTALVSLRAEARSRTQDRLVEFLRDRSERLGSGILSAVAARALSDPFGKIKTMIQDLIRRLTEEAGQEAEHKGWCDTELATNEKTRTQKTEAVDTLNAEIDELTASNAKLGNQLSDLSKAVSELDEAVAEATKLRAEEKKKNTQTIEDSKEAQTAVAQAITVLKDFYAKASQATALLQQAPEIFDSPYKGMQSENGGIVGMLEVIQSDFARIESETKVSEATAQKEYDEFVSESKIDKASKTADIKNKSRQKQDQEAAVETKKDDLEGTQEELNTALAYFDKLKPSCVDNGISYKERVARREEEIESLQEALKILSGDSI